MIKIRTLYGNFARANKGIIAFGFGLTLCSNLLAILIPLLIGKYYQLAFGLQSSRAQLLDFIPESFTNTALAFFIFFSVCIVLRLASFYSSDYLIGVIGERLVKRMRSTLFEAHMHIPIEEYKQGGTGKFLLRFTGDLNSIKNHFTNGVLKSSSDIILFIFAFFVIASMSMELMTMMLIVLIVGFAILFALHSRVYKSLETFRNRKSNIISFVSRTFSVVHSIFVFNKQSTEIKKFDQYATKIYQSAKQYLSIHFLYKTLILAISYSFLLVTLIYGYYNQYAGINSSDLLVTIMLIMTLLAPMRRLFRIGLILEKGKLSWLKYARVINRQKPDVGLSFKYVDETIRLDEKIQLKPGINALIRDTQSNVYVDQLLADIHDDEGKVHVGDMKLNSMCKKQWRKNVAVVDPRYPLIGRTVFEAISYSRAASKRKKAQQILDLINSISTDDVRFELNDKIGANGSWLTKQDELILMYTRAILSKKPIILINHESFPEIQDIVDLLMEYIEQNSRYKMTVIFRNRFIKSKRFKTKNKKAI